MYRREDLPPRPLTPYPFSSDPSWRAIKKLRSDRRPPYLEQSVHIGRLTYEYLAPYEIDGQVPFSRDRRDAVPWPSAMPDPKIDRYTLPRTRPAEQRRSVLNSTSDQDIQQQILAQNERIASRPLPTPRVRRVGRKVRFQLPRNGETSHSGTDLARQFERLHVKEAPSPWCSSCGQRLSCRRCGPSASENIE